MIKIAAILDKARDWLPNSYKDPLIDFLNQLASSGYNQDTELNSTQCAHLLEIFQKRWQLIANTDCNYFCTTSKINALYWDIAFVVGIKLDIDAALQRSDMEVDRESKSFAESNPRSPYQWLIPNVANSLTALTLDPIETHDIKTCIITTDSDGIHYLCCIDDITATFQTKRMLVNPYHPSTPLKDSEIRALYRHHYATWCQILEQAYIFQQFFKDFNQATWQHLEALAISFAKNDTSYLVTTFHPYFQRLAPAIQQSIGSVQLLIDTTLGQRLLDIFDGKRDGVCLSETASAIKQLSWQAGLYQRLQTLKQQFAQEFRPRQHGALHSHHFHRRPYQKTAANYDVKPDAGKSATKATKRKAY